MEPTDPALAFAIFVGAYLGSLLLAFLVSRLGLYIRRSSRYEPSTLVGVHVICFFLLGLISCSSGKGHGSPGLTAFFAQLTIFLIDYFRLPDPDDYRDDEPQKPSRIKPLGAALIAGAMALGIAVPFFVGKPRTDAEIVADLEEGLNSKESSRIYFASIKRNFPDEYRGIIGDLLERTREADRGGGSDQAVLQNAQQDVVSRMRSLLARHRADMARAPVPALNAYSRVMKNFMLQAQKDAPYVCAAYALTGPSPSLLQSMPERMEVPMAKLNAATLDLAKAGMDRPARDEAVRPPEEMLRLLGDRWRARLQPELREIVGNRRAVPTRSTEEQCRIALAYYSAITELPPEASAAVAAYDLAPYTVFTR